MKSMLIALGISLLFGFSSSMNNKILSKVRLSQAPSANVTELLPQTFWVDEQGKPGRDFVVFRDLKEMFMICNPDGKLLLEAKNMTRNSLFNVIEFDNDHIGLRSINGGYLTYKDKAFMCNEKKLDEKTGKLEIIRKIDLPNIPKDYSTLAFKIENGYYGFENNTAILFKDINPSSVLLSPLKAEEVLSLAPGENKLEKFKP